MAGPAGTRPDPVKAEARKVAFLFPGQGSQYAGMGRELQEAFPVCREVFEQADQALGLPLSEVIFSGPEEALTLTENTQPAILTVSVAATRALALHGVRPALVAGHSLGEYSALVAAGGLDLPLAVGLVRKRGRYMQEAVPVGQGAMAAILGLEAKRVEDLCTEAAGAEVVVAANYNAPDQTVIAGDRAAVERAVKLAEAAGAKRAVLLAVSAPFHSPRMAPVERRLAADLEAARFADLEVELITNVDARPVRSGSEARTALIRQVTAPVRWTDSLRRLIDLGVTTVVEVGPGKVLGGLARKIDRGLELLNVEDVKSLERTVAALGGKA